MNDEIKEILEYLKNDFYAYDEIYIEEKCKIVSKKENHQLLDYITNLQTIEQQYSAILSENAELENKITNLQEENEKLQNENETLKELNVCVGCENNIDYKSRCEKAIEYINERKNLNWYADGVFVEELLNILNGGGEE